MAEKSKYQLIADWIKKCIDTGEWKTGDRLPSENELAAEFKVSRQTIRRALEILTAGGIISKNQGSGTFVGTRNQIEQETRERFNSIAVISTYVEQYIFPYVLKGIEEVLSKKGYTLQLSFTNDSIFQEKRILEKIIENDNVDGIIVEPAKGALVNPNLDLYERLQEMGIPIIFFHDIYPELSFPLVRMDDEQVAARAVRLLIENGHKRIAGIFHSEDGQGRRRYTGYIKELWAHGLAVDPKQTIWLESDMLENMELMEEYLFSRLYGVTGIICYNDVVAASLVDMAIKRGIKVPKELSVVGIDDSYLAREAKVALTTFRHPQEKLGIRLGENMLEMLSNPAFDGNYVFDSELIVRDSISRRKEE